MCEMKTTKFKMTELGPTPEDWEVKRLGDVGEPLMCKRVLKSQTFDTGDISFFKIGTFGGIADAYISRSLYESFRRKYPYPKKGDVLLSAAGTIGRTVVYDGKDAYFQDSNIVWVDNDEKIVLNDYLYWWYKVILWNTEDGGIVTRLYNSNLKASLIAVPPLPEQRKIAEALSDVDELISALGKLIEKKRNIKTGAMQQLLTGKTRLPRFKGKWEEKRLGDCGFCFNGLTGKSGSDFGHGKACYITFLNVLTNVVIDSSIFEPVDICSGENQNEVRRGDIFFNTSSETPEEVGLCAVLEEDVKSVYLNSFCFGFRITDNDVSGRFLAYWFRASAGRALMTSLAQGSTRYNLSKDAFREACVCIPPTLAEQKAIAAVLSDMDAEIAALEADRAKYERIKSGMMQELLTGKTRLEA